MAEEKIDALSLDITSNLDIDKLDKAIDKLSELEKALGRLKSKSVSVNIKEVGTASEQASSGVDKLTSSFFGQAIRITAVIAVFRKLTNVISDSIANSASYIKTLNMFNTSLGQYADNATKYGETISQALGIDIAGWQETQGIFDTLIKGMGVASDKAAYMSQNLTQLAYDISSYYGITLTEAANKLKSAMGGRVQPVRQIGYSIEQSRAVDYAKNPANYGKQTFAINQQTGAIEANTVALDKNTQHRLVNYNQMTSDQKAIITYNLLMTENTQIQGNFARALNDPYNQMRIFRDQVNQTSRAFGNLFIPALNKVLPYLSAFAQLATEAFQSLAQLFGFKLPDMKDRTSIDTKPYDHVVKATGKAAKNAKKMKDYMLGIDELNVFNPDTGVGAGGGAGTKGQQSNLNNMLLKGYDFLSKAVEASIKKAKEAIQKFFTDLKKNPFILKDIFVWGAGELGADFWEGFLGKTPAQLAADARKHGRTILGEFATQAVDAFKEKVKDFQTGFWSIFLGMTPEELKQKAYDNGTTIEYEMMRGFMEKTPGEVMMNILFGSPEEYAQTAMSAGNTVGEQFTLGLYKALLEFSRGNVLFKTIFELVNGRGSFEDTIAEIEHKLQPKSKKQKKVENPYKYVSADQAKELSRIQGGAATPVVSASAKLMLQTNMTTDNAKQEARNYINTYSNALSGGKTTVQNAANNGIFLPSLKGADGNGNGVEQFKFVASANAKSYAGGLGSGQSETESEGLKLYNSGLNGVKGNGSTVNTYKYVSQDQAKSYYTNLATSSAKNSAKMAGSALATSGSTGAHSSGGGFHDAGEDAGAGYIAGIQTKRNLRNALAAGATLGANTLNNLKKTLGIASPSKAFAEAGMWSVKGYANAITDNSKLATSAAANMGRAALSALGNASDMSNKLILNGTIADPSASVSARASNASGIGYGIGVANEGAMATLASQIYQAVVSGMSAVKEDGEKQDIKVIIDGKEVFKAVQTESRKRGVAISNGTFSR